MLWIVIFVIAICFLYAIKRSFPSESHDDDKSTSQNDSTIDPRELKQFNSDSIWWSKETAPLVAFNSVRVPLIRDGILEMTKSKSKDMSLPLEGFSILDVGCGGGLLSEPLARLGATVTGLDPGDSTIRIAREHAEKDESIKNRLHYVCDTIEHFSQQANRYDAVVCSEVVEHVDNVPLFVQLSSKLVKDGGSLFFTTPHKSNLSYIIMILISEYVLGVIPKYTHDWNKFILPEDLQAMLESHNCKVVRYQGIFFNPFTTKWRLSKGNDTAYALHAVKESSPQ